VVRRLLILVTLALALLSSNASAWHDVHGIHWPSGSEAWNRQGQWTPLLGGPGGSETRRACGYANQCRVIIVHDWLGGDFAWHQARNAALLELTKLTGYRVKFAVRGHNTIRYVQAENSDARMDQVPIGAIALYKGRVDLTPVEARPGAAMETCGDSKFMSMVNPYNGLDAWRSYCAYSSSWRGDDGHAGKHIVRGYLKLPGFRIHTFRHEMGHAWALVMPTS